MPALHGTQHHSCRLTDDDVLRIRTAYLPGKVTYAALASRYGVSEQAIAKIINRLSWRHL
jgi:uncharacterized protein YjcR